MANNVSDAQSSCVFHAPHKDWAVRGDPGYFDQQNWEALEQWSMRPCFGVGIAKAEYIQNTNCPNNSFTFMNFSTATKVGVINPAAFTETSNGVIINLTGFLLINGYTQWGNDGPTGSIAECDMTDTLGNVTQVVLIDAGSGANNVAIPHGCGAYTPATDKLQINYHQTTGVAMPSVHTDITLTLVTL